MLGAPEMWFLVAAHHTYLSRHQRSYLLSKWARLLVLETGTSQFGGQGESAPSVTTQFRLTPFPWFAEGVIVSIIERRLAPVSPVIRSLVGPLAVSGCAGYVRLLMGANSRPRQPALPLGLWAGARADSAAALSESSSGMPMV